MGSVILIGSSIGLDLLTYILSGAEIESTKPPTVRWPLPTPCICGILNITQMLFKVHGLPDWKDFPASRRIDFPQMYFQMMLL